MKCLAILLIAAAATAPAAPEPTGTVSLPLSEFRKLTTPPPRPVRAPMVPYAVKRSSWKLTPHRAHATGRVVLDIEVFSEHPCFIPVLPAGLSLQGFSPSDCLLIVKDGRLGLMTKSPGPLTLTIDLALGGQSENGRWVSEPIPEGPVLTTVELAKSPDGFEVGIPGAFAGEDGLLHPKAGSSWNLVMARHEAPQKAPALPPVVTTANAESKVVADGATLTTTRLSIRHQDPFDWELVLPDGSELISCQVNGRATLPARPGNNTIALRLPESSKETVIEFSYTGKTSAFQPVRGDFEISLPSTRLLVERWDWRLILPAAYEPVALEGNVELQPGGSRNVIPLAREITHGDAPSLRVFYEKPETKKPQ